MKTSRLLKMLSLVAVMMLMGAKGYAQSEPEKIFLVGDATANGWRGENNEGRSQYQALWSVENEDKVYRGYQYLKKGNLKFTSWEYYWSRENEYLASAANTAINGEGEFDIVQGVQGGDDNQFVIESPGFYTIEIDLKTMKLTLTSSREWSGEAYNGNLLDDLVNPAITDKYISAVGDATASGWDAGNPAVKLTRDPANRFVYRTVASLKKGEFKFLTSTYFEGFGFRYDERLNGIFFTAGDWQNDRDTKITIQEAGEYYIILNLEENTLILEPLKLFVVGGNNLSKWSLADAIELNKVNGTTKFKGIIYLSSEDLRGGENDNDPSFKMTIKKEAEWDSRYFFFRNETNDNKIAKDPSDDRKWTVSETGEYLLEVDVKEETISMTKLAENTLIDAEKVFVTTGSYCGSSAFSTLTDALGTNNTITSLQFNTGVDSELAAMTTINPNCLIYLPEGTTDAPTAWTKNTIAGTTAITPIVLKDRDIIEGQLKDYPFSCPAEVIAAQGVSYTRNCFNDANWETILLPFAVEEFNAFNDYTIEGFTSEDLDNNKLIFTKMESLNEWEANKAYIMKSNANTGAANMEFKAGSNAIVKTITTAATGFTGTYSTIANEGVTGKYVLTPDGNQFGKAGNGNRLPAFRAFYIPADEGNEPAPSRTFSVEHQNATGIATEFETSDTRAVNIYSIDGVLIKTIEPAEGKNTIEGLAKGIYIINGKKVVL